MGMRDPLDSPSRQMNLCFEPGLTQRHRCLREVVSVGVHQRGLTAMAGKMDLSPSKISEKLSGGVPGRPRDVGLMEFERYLDASGDRLPIFYLIEKYLSDPQMLQAEALSRVTTLIEGLPALLAAAGLTGKKAGRS